MFLNATYCSSCNFEICDEGRWNSTITVALSSKEGLEKRKLCSSFHVVAMYITTLAVVSVWLCLRRYLISRQQTKANLRAMKKHQVPVVFLLNKFNLLLLKCSAFGRHY